MLFNKNLRIYTGDELLTLGYPYGADSNDYGFSILRSGKIASYPLTPTKINGTFLLDFEIFDGNSGGPVFINMEGRRYGGSIHIQETTRLIMGLVSRQEFLKEHVKSIDQELLKKHPLSLAEIVHASFIKELILMLPPL